MLGFIHHAKFKAVLSEFMNKMSAVPRWKRHVNVLLVDPKGSKRAPGCATLLQYIMQNKSTAFCVTEDIRHMSEDAWSLHLDLCSSCKYPRAQSRYTEVGEKALQKWLQVQACFAVLLFMCARPALFAILCRRCQALFAILRRH